MKTFNYLNRRILDCIIIFTTISSVLSYITKDINSANLFYTIFELYISFIGPIIWVIVIVLFPLSTSWTYLNSDINIADIIPKTKKEIFSKEIKFFIGRLLILLIINISYLIGQNGYEIENLKIVFNTVFYLIALPFNTLIDIILVSLVSLKYRLSFIKTTIFYLSFNIFNICLTYTIYKLNMDIDIFRFFIVRTLISVIIVLVYIFSSKIYIEGINRNKIIRHAKNIVNEFKKSFIKKNYMILYGVIILYWGSVYAFLNNKAISEKALDNIPKEGMYVEINKDLFLSLSNSLGGGIGFLLLIITLYITIVCFKKIETIKYIIPKSNATIVYNDSKFIVLAWIIYILPNLFINESFVDSRVSTISNLSNSIFYTMLLTIFIFIVSKLYKKPLVTIIDRTIYIVAISYFLSISTFSARLTNSFIIKGNFAMFLFYILLITYIFYNMVKPIVKQIKYNIVSNS